MSHHSGSDFGCGCPVPPHIAEELRAMFTEARSERLPAPRFELSAAELRRMLAAAEKREANELAEYLRSLRPTRWYRR